METAVNTSVVKMFPYGDVMDWMTKIRHLENCLKSEGWSRKKNRKLSDTYIEWLWVPWLTLTALQ